MGLVLVPVFKFLEQCSLLKKPIRNREVKVFKIGSKSPKTSIFSRFTPNSSNSITWICLPTYKT